MKIDFVTFVLLAFGVSYLIGFIVNRMRNKTTRNIVAKYTKIINMILSNDKDDLSAMEYNDRYTIIFNKGELSKFGMIRLLKGEKKLLILEETLTLTNKEYEKLLETLKPAL